MAEDRFRALTPQSREIPIEPRRGKIERGERWAAKLPREEKVRMAGMKKKTI